MSKQNLKIVLLATVLSFGLQLFFGRNLSAMISTWPVVNRLNILSPQAPIVINKREQIKVSESGDAKEMVQAFKSRVSALVHTKQGATALIGSVTNITAEGLVVSTKEQVKFPADELRVVANDGRIGKVIKIISDPSSELVFLQTDLRNLSVASLARSSELAAGEKVYVIYTAALENSSRFLSSYISGVQDDYFGRIFNSDIPSKDFSIQKVEGLAAGQAIVNSKGELSGVVAMQTVLSSDHIRLAINSINADQARVLRPAFGFSYTVIGRAEAEVLGQKQGAKVVEVGGKETPAFKAGLQKNDLIIRAGGENLDKGLHLEDVLYRSKPGERIELVVVRGGNEIKLSLIAGEKLK
jgi:serine protease DegS